MDVVGEQLLADARLADEQHGRIERATAASRARIVRIFSLRVTTAIAEVWSLIAFRSAELLATVFVSPRAGAGWPIYRFPTVRERSVTGHPAAGAGSAGPEETRPPARGS